MIADRARFRIAKRIERLAGYRLPDRAFNGTMLEALSSGINFDAFDVAVREQLVLELRENGLDHRQISSFLLDEYGIEIFPADVLSFLEDSVHVLEAINDIARLKGRQGLAKKTGDHIRLIER